MAKNEQVDFQAKVLIIGNSKVGKSCILLRYANDTFNTNMTSTVGIDFKNKIEIASDNMTKIKLQLWDTAGQERFRPIISNFYKSTKACVLVFDLTDLRSLKDIEYWIKELNSNCEESIPKVLVGNKIDLLEKANNNEEEQKAFEDSVNSLTESLSLPYYRCSALTGENVNLAFKNLASQIKSYYNVQSKQKNQDEDDDDDDEDDLSSGDEQQQQQVNNIVSDNEYSSPSKSHKSNKKQNQDDSGSYSPSNRISLSASPERYQKRKKSKSDSSCC